MIEYTNEYMYVDQERSDCNLYPFNCQNATSKLFKEKVVTKILMLYLKQHAPLDTCAYLGDNEDVFACCNIYNACGLVSFNSLIISIIYVERVLYSYEVKSKTDFLKLFYVSMLLASKYMCDFVINNELFADLTISNDEINYIEENILEMLNFDLIVCEDEYNTVIKRFS